ncbi:MAG: DUF5040 domain-containing protein [Paludibacter sp.]|nr:DUF5040 domain-containing protein [Paludibacter sp.]
MNTMIPMKPFILAIIISLFSLVSKAEEKQQPFFMLSGASFAIPENTWFEMGCEAFGARSINKAVSGDAIMNTAVDMMAGKYYTWQELEKTDVFVIMHVHNYAVANELTLKENFRDYTEEEIKADYAAAYDYVIKRYKDDCFQLRNNPSSKFFGTETGKPAVIVLCTHWHDSRTIFNADIRKLAAKWHLHLIKFDENIGFTKDVLVDGKQPSLQYASDIQTIDGVVYGQHPFRGKNQYIQQKMAQIFIAGMEELLGKIPPTALLHDKSSAILSGEDAYVSFSFLGNGPFNLTYKVNDQTIALNNITSNPALIKVNNPSDGVTTVEPVSVSNSTETEGVVAGKASVRYADKVDYPFFDTYVHQVSNITSYETSTSLQLKGKLGNYARETYFSFRLNNISMNDERIILRAYFYKTVYSGESVQENHLVEIAGNSDTYSGLIWNNKPEDMTVIGETVISPADVESYITWDITDWVKQQLSTGKEVVTVRLSVQDYATGLLYFYSSESKVHRPQLLTVSKFSSGVINEGQDAVKSFYNPSDKKIHVNSLTPLDDLSIISAEGKCYFRSKDIGLNTYSIDAGNLPDGVYMLRVQGDDKKEIRKIIITN